MLVVLGLVGGGLVLRAGRPGSADPAPRLAALRAAAALEPCPGGLGRGLPDVTLGCLGGGPPVRLAAPVARPTLVSIWATWCVPCVREVPLLSAYARSTAGRVDVVGVLHEDTAENALEFARQMQMHYPSVLDPGGGVLRRFGSGPPITLAVRADGTVAGVRQGAFADRAELAAFVRDRLGVSS